MNWYAKLIDGPFKYVDVLPNGHPKELITQGQYEQLEEEKQKEWIKYNDR